MHFAIENCNEIHKQAQPLAAAKILQAIVTKEQPSLILLGKQAIDDDSNATGQMLAGLLNISQVLDISMRICMF